MTILAVPWTCKVPQTMWEAWRGARDSVWESPLQKCKKLDNETEYFLPAQLFSWKYFNKWEHSCAFCQDWEPQMFAVCSRKYCNRIRKITSLQKWQQRLKHFMQWEAQSNMRVYSCKTKKAHRYKISSVTASQPRKGITGELEWKINSNLNNRVISKPAFTTDLKSLNEK